MEVYLAKEQWEHQGEAAQGAEVTVCLACSGSNEEAAEAAAGGASGKT